MKRVKLFFAWYDIWVGVYIDKGNERLYICLLPTIVIKIDYKKYYKCITCGKMVDFIDNEKQCYCCYVDEQGM